MVSGFAGKSPRPGMTRVHHTESVSALANGNYLNRNENGAGVVLVLAGAGVGVEATGWLRGRGFCTRAALAGRTARTWCARAGRATILGARRFAAARFCFGGAAVTAGAGSAGAGT